MVVAEIVGSVFSLIEFMPSTLVKVSLVVDTVGNSVSVIVVGYRVVFCLKGWVVFIVVVRFVSAEEVVSAVGDVVVEGVGKVNVEMEVFDVEVEDIDVLVKEVVNFVVEVLDVAVNVVGVVVEVAGIVNVLEVVGFVVKAVGCAVLEVIDVDVVEIVSVEVEIFDDVGEEINILAEVVPVRIGIAKDVVVVCAVVEDGDVTNEGVNVAVEDEDNRVE